MRHQVLSDQALLHLSLRAWKARGGFLFPLHVVTIGNAAETTVRIVDIREAAHTIGVWTVGNYTDVPDMIRQIERQDRFFSGLVFHDRIENGRCFWELVHPVTLDPSHMFARVWREPYGAI